jgi:hypothetical protein
LFVRLDECGFSHAGGIAIDKFPGQHRQGLINGAAARSFEMQSTIVLMTPGLLTLVLPLAVFSTAAFLAAVFLAVIELSCVADPDIREPLWEIQP